jgi:tetratricopeptide (TPR) repeat protein
MSILTERLEYPPVGDQILKEVASMPFNTSTGLNLSARGIDISKQVAHYMGEYAQKQFREAQRRKDSFTEMIKIAKFATDFVSSARDARELDSGELVLDPCLESRAQVYLRGKDRDLMGLAEALVRDARELDSGELVLDPCLESRAQVYLRGKDRDLFIECLDEAVGRVAPEKRAKVAYHLHGLIASVPDLMGLAEALVRDARELDSGELVLDPCLESRAQVYLRGKDRDLFIECLDEAVGRVAPEKRAKVAYHLHGLIASVPDLMGLAEALVRDARELDSGELVLDPCLESRAQVYLRGKDRDLFIECLDEAVGRVAPEKRAKVAYHLHGLIASVPDLMGLAEALVRDARELDSGELVLDPCLESRAQVYLRGKDRDLFIECLDEAVGRVAPEKRAKVAYHLHGLIASVPDLMGLAEALVRDARELDSGELVLDPCLESRAQVYLRGKDRDLFIECLDEAVGRVAPEKRAKVAYRLHGLIAPVPTGNTTESSHGSEC